jgi:hypothetical protein
MGRNTADAPRSALLKGKKMPMWNRITYKEQNGSPDAGENHANSKISLKINNGIGKFYE